MPADLLCRSTAMMPPQPRVEGPARQGNVLRSAQRTGGMAGGRTRFPTQQPCAAVLHERHRALKHNTPQYRTVWPRPLRHVLSAPRCLGVPALGVHACATLPAGLLRGRPSA
jgi:hypothetical protein